MGILILIAIIAVYCYFDNKEENDIAENICNTYRQANNCDRGTAIAKIKVDAMNSNNKQLHEAAKRLN